MYIIESQTRRINDTKSDDTLSTVMGGIMKDVFEVAVRELETQHDIMLVTIVTSAGSAPRKAGSQMVVNANGRLVGTIGGGNIEYLSEHMACDLLAQKTSCLHSFNLNEKDTDGLGMICGGDVDVWFQYISPDDDVWHDVAQAVIAAVEGKRGGWLVQNLTGSAPCLLSAQKELLAGELLSDVDALCTSKCAHVGDFFALPLPRKERVYIFGGGHIAQALVPILASVDFSPIVFDNRPEYADPARFPQADNVILGDYLAIADYVQLDPEDYVAVMTHGHSHDFEIQAQVLRYDLAYVGVVGSARKTRAVNERLHGVGIPEEKTATIHTPIGTKIAADTPAEIAVSIAGELIAVRAERRAAAAH